MQKSRQAEPKHGDGQEKDDDKIFCKPEGCNCEKLSLRDIRGKVKNPHDHMLLVYIGMFQY